MVNNVAKYSFRDLSLYSMAMDMDMSVSSNGEVHIGDFHRGDYLVFSKVNEEPREYKLLSSSDRYVDEVSMKKINKFFSKANKLIYKMDLLLDDMPYELFAEGHRKKIALVVAFSEFKRLFHGRFMEDSK